MRPSKNIFLHKGNENTDTKGQSQLFENRKQANAQALGGGYCFARKAVSSGAELRFTIHAISSMEYVSSCFSVIKCLVVGNICQSHGSESFFFLSAFYRYMLESMQQDHFPCKSLVSLIISSTRCACEIVGSVFHSMDAESLLGSPSPQLGPCCHGVRGSWRGVRRDCFQLKTSAP